MGSYAAQMKPFRKTALCVYLRPNSKVDCLLLCNKPDPCGLLWLETTSVLLSLMGWLGSAGLFFHSMWCHLSHCPLRADVVLENLRWCWTPQWGLSTRVPRLSPTQSVCMAGVFQSMFNQEHPKCKHSKREEVAVPSVLELPGLRHLGVSHLSHFTGQSNHRASPDSRGGEISHSWFKERHGCTGRRGIVKDCISHGFLENRTSGVCETYTNSGGGGDWERREIFKELIHTIVQADKSKIYGVGQLIGNLEKNCLESEGSQW